MVPSDHFSCGLRRLLLVALIIQEGPKFARVHPRHFRNGRRLQRASQVIRRRHQVVALGLVRAYDDVEALAGMKVESGQHYGVNILAIHRDQRHVMAVELKQEILRLAHHANQAKTIALTLIHGNQGPRVLGRPVAPLAIPRCLVDLLADRVAGLRTLHAKADVRIRPFVAKHYDSLLIVEMPMRVFRRMDDDRALQSPVHLVRLHVGVPPVRARVWPEPVSESAALCGNPGLCYTIHAVHRGEASHM
mmetsp:Transcript_42033/g.121889  ORF Transcript_42033/g.121889 Transcript_42033/m.121889 type:complete len:248 (+) Transcript_42033:946-1689(+)